MFVRAAIVTLLIAGGGAVASAQQIGGKYRAEGTDQSGTQYKGTVEIVRVSETSCRIEWNDGSAGICLISGDTLTAAFMVHGAIGVGLYTVSPDGVIEGTYIDDFHGGGIEKVHQIGSETFTPIGQ
jgi:hypothetical protein